MTADRSARRSELVALLRRRREAAPVPLTATQEGIWLAEQIDPGESGYHDCIVLRIDGPLDPAALRAATADAQARHEALRVRVDPGDGQPVQHFDAGPVSFEYEEVPGADPAGTAVRRRLALVASTPFDLPAGPLWRVRLLRTGDGTHVLIVVLHHLITDGASHPVLLRAVLGAYAARSGGSAPTWPVPPSYRDWLLAKVAREADVARGRRVDAVAARLAGLPRRFELPGQHPGPTGRLADIMEIDVDTATWASFRGSCRRLATTPYMALGGLFGALLAGESGAGDVVMSAPVANRLHPREHELLGCLIDVVPIRVTAHPRDTAVDAIWRGRDGVLAALAHADVPYRYVVRAVGAPGGADDPLTNIGLEEFNLTPAPLRTAGLLVTPLPRDQVRLRHDLALSVPVAPDARPALLAPARRWAPGRLAELAAGLSQLIRAVPAD